MNAPLLIELDTFLKEHELELQSNDFDFITSLNWKSTVTLKCLKCNTIFDITIKQLLRPHPPRDGIICPRCNAEDLFIKKLTEIYGENPYNFVVEFKGYNEPLAVQCKTCNYVWTTKAARNLLMGKNLPEGTHPCKQCSTIRNFKQDVPKFEKILEEKFGACNYEFLSENFTGAYSKKKINVKCKKCENEFIVNPSNILNPKNGIHYCKFCNKRGRKKKDI